MHKVFYASGFFYHTPSGQILLLKQSDGDELRLSMCRTKNLSGETPLTAFIRAVKEAFGLTVNGNDVLPVYDYIHMNLGNHYIYYIEVSGSLKTKKFTLSNAGWYPLEKLSKINLSAQTRHDLIIAGRVIRANEENVHHHDGV